jgi:hypothetical protein
MRLFRSGSGNETDAIPALEPQRNENLLVNSLFPFAARSDVLSTSGDFHH